MTLIARFAVDSFEPRQVTGLETADWFSVMTFAKTFTAGITGHATTVFMSAGTEEGSRSYVATERITGRTERRSTRPERVTSRVSSSRR